ncbi:hypothetical protein [Treponema succinifaciens]|uniref:Sulphatase-modifying factor protein n=1 Tax=Treponema succinifaciens (strain ATCC 33096 / DSM 2489 / 6091) TaxID=869209 RepID=F2NTE4_TRES6|nr:hypothetical protein [Treponema succinifaciens]AEB14867.1 Sulphatase-modifying factor protein [Treponema succinifaciens DSM 2489]
MKRIKNIVAVLAALVLGTSFVFADKAQYDKLLAEGKAYEEKGQWVHAMGAYWDAMEAEEKRNGTEAYEAFLKITKALQEGNPGIGTFDDFSLYDGWVSLCKDYEIYWNEHVSEIYALSFTYKKDALDMKTRTATYDFGVFQRTTPKFEYIYAAVKGLDKSRRKDWVEIPGMWPTVSIFKDSSTIPVVTYTWDYSKDKRDPYEVYYGEEVKLKRPSIFAIHSFQNQDFRVYTPQGKISTVTMPAWSVLNRAVLEEGKNLYGGNFSCIEWESAIKIQFHIDDENGRTIGKMDKASYMYPDIKKYGQSDLSVSCNQKISGIAASDVKIMDEGKFSIIIDTFTLNPNSTQTEYNQNRKKIDSETKAKITAELPAFNLKPSSKTKAYKGMNESKLEKIFNESYTPNDVAIETAVMTTFRNKGFIGIVDDSEQFCILTEELELQGMVSSWEVNNKNIYKIPLPIEREYFRDCVDFIKILGKIEGTEFKEGWCKQNHREISDYTERCFYRPVTESEKKALEERLAAEAKAKADAEAKKIADMLAKISPEPKDYASILVDYQYVSQLGGDSDNKKHKLSNYEVTQYLFEKLMGYNPSKRQNPLYPVTNISFYEIMVFCNKLSIAAGLTPVYTINKSTNPDDWGTVPTEKDKKWEKYSMNKKANGYCLNESLRVPSRIEKVVEAAPGFVEFRYIGKVEGCKNLWEKVSDYTFRVEKKN